MPEEVKHARLKTAQEMISKNQVNKTLSAEVVRKPEIIATNTLFSCINTKRKTTNSNDDLQTTRKKKNRKDEAREIFKNMLDELSVSWKDTWEQALKTIINDPRYNETIRSTSERKALFIEWSKEKDKCEREEILWRRQNTRKEFLQLLEQSNILNI
jgi:hypothetical protein